MNQHDVHRLEPSRRVPARCKFNYVLFGKAQHSDLRSQSSYPNRRAHGVVGYHARLADHITVCERCWVQFPMCPIFLSGFFFFFFPDIMYSNILFNSKQLSSSVRSPGPLSDQRLTSNFYFAWKREYCIAMLMNPVELRLFYRKSVLHSEHITSIVQ